MRLTRPGFGVYAKLVSTMVLWGGTWVSARVVSQSLAAFPAAFLRFFFASVFLYVLLCRASARQGGGWPKLTRALLPGSLLMAVTGVFLYNALFFSGMKFVPAGRAAMIVACVPSAVALYSGLVLRAPTGLVKSLGIALSLLGVSVILSGGNPVSLFTQGAAQGDLYILGCVATWAAYTLAGGYAMRRATPLAAVAWSCILGCAMLLPPALGTGLLEQLFGISWIVWANLAFLGVAATGLAFIWYLDGIQALGAPRASVFINLVPVFATLMGSLMLGEGVGLSLVFGGVMVLSGVVLANRPSNPPPTQSGTPRPAK